MRSAFAKGRYFNSHIRNRFRYRRSDSVHGLSCHITCLRSRMSTGCPQIGNR
nr:hypothetical protein [Mesorhizobium sp.]